jgi:biuret amidohydrolase
MQRAFGLEVPQTLAEVCAPSRTALVVYDMQVGILGQIATAESVTSRVLEVLGAAREGGVRVFFIRYMSLPRELMGVSQLRMAMAWQRVASVDQIQPWFLRDSPGFPLVPEISPLPSEAIFDRITMSAFEGTPLDIALRDCGITSFVIVGVAMEIGIEPTVRHGADLGYIPIVVTDACGAGHAEAAARSIASLKFTGDAILTTTQELSRIWQVNRAAARTERTPPAGGTAGRLRTRNDAGPGRP